MMEKINPISLTIDARMECNADFWPKMNFTEQIGNNAIMTFTGEVQI